MRTRSRFWLISAAALFSLLATLSLGRWQLSRAAQKEALQANLQAQGKLPVLDASALVTEADPTRLLQRVIHLRGTWVADKTVFLDNRPMNAKVGFYVVTPLQLEGSEAVVLVQRGWVQRNFENRASLPMVTTPAGVVELRGRISPSPSKLYELGGPEFGLIRQNLDLVQFRAETRLALLPVSVQQISAEANATSDGLSRDWPAVGFGIEKHYGYAFQWFGLSGLIVILYVWFQIVRKLRPSR